MASIVPTRCRPGLAPGLMLLAALLTGCGSVSAGPDAGDAWQEPELESISVTPDVQELVTSTTLQLYATGNYSDGSTQDITTAATWTSSNQTYAIVSDGLVGGLARGNVTITAELDGVSGSTTLQVRRPYLMAVSSYTPNRVTFYDPEASGNTAPVRTIEGENTQLQYPRGMAAYNDELFVANAIGSSVTVYSWEDNGNVAPRRQLAGGSTTIGSPYSVNVHDDELFVFQQGRVLVFPLDADGDVAPSRTITGDLTRLVSPMKAVVHEGELYVANLGASMINVFPVDAAGNVAPTRTIEGPNTELGNPLSVFVHDGELLVSSANHTIRVFPVASSGDVPPLRVIEGGSTGLGYPDQILVYGGEIYSANYNNSSLRVFPLNGNGDIEPTRILSGDITLLSGAIGVAIH